MTARRGVPRKDVSERISSTRPAAMPPSVRPLRADPGRGLEPFRAAGPALFSGRSADECSTRGAQESVKVRSEGRHWNARSAADGAARFAETWGVGFRWSANGLKTGPAQKYFWVELPRARLVPRPD